VHQQKMISILPFILLTCCFGLKEKQHLSGTADKPEYEVVFDKSKLMKFNQQPRMLDKLDAQQESEIQVAMTEETEGEEDDQVGTVTTELTITIEKIPADKPDWKSFLALLKGLGAVEKGLGTETPTHPPIASVAFFSETPAAAKTVNDLVELLAKLLPEKEGVDDKHPVKEVIEYFLRNRNNNIKGDKFQCSCKNILRKMFQLKSLKDFETAQGVDGKEDFKKIYWGRIWQQTLGCPDYHVWKEDSVFGKMMHKGCEYKG